MSAKKILILGPESTGKSTLASELSAYYGEPFVPEFSRQYLENLNRAYDFDDLSTIAKGQLAEENALFSKSKQFLFCDTDLRVIHIWSFHKYGKTAPWILEEIAQRSYAAILLTQIDLPWEADPLREHPQPEMREYFFNEYLKLTEESGLPFAIVSGSKKDRLQKAITFIENEI